MPTQQSFVTDTATTLVAARHVEEVSEAIDAEMRALDNRIQPITGWSGCGKQAYMGLHAKWMEDAAKLRQVLSEISQGLVKTGTQYQTNEDEVVAQMTRKTAQA